LSTSIQKVDSENSLTSARRSPADARRNSRDPLSIDQLDPAFDRESRAERSMKGWRTPGSEIRLTDPDEVAAPREMTALEAQDVVNFVVFEPAWLPSDCDVSEITVRPEQPPGRPGDIAAEAIGQTPWSDGNPCSLRLLVTDGDRTIRIKQFLYDWAPCSGGIAPLWGTLEPTPFECGDAIGWLGTDYKDNRGGCVQRKRTQIELSVTEGEFDDGDLMRLLDELTPASETATRLQRVPFHHLCYWVRHRCQPPGVPHGLWAHNPARPYHECDPLSPVALATDSSPSSLSPLVPAGRDFVLDSAVAFPEGGAFECVFRNRANGSDHLFVTGAPEDSALAPSIPPESARQPAEKRHAVDLRGTEVHYAALSEARGAWEAVWAEDGAHYAVYAGASAQLDGERFRDLVDGMTHPDSR
jgi:hypothetical protein